MRTHQTPKTFKLSEVSLSPSTCTFRLVPTSNHLDGYVELFIDLKSRTYSDFIKRDTLTLGKTFAVNMQSKSGGNGNFFRLRDINQVTAEVALLFDKNITLPVSLWEKALSKGKINKDNVFDLFVGNLPAHKILLEEEND